MCFSESVLPSFDVSGNFELSLTRSKFGIDFRVRVKRAVFSVRRDLGLSRGTLVYKNSILRYLHKCGSLT